MKIVTLSTVALALTTPSTSQSRIARTFATRGGQVWIPAEFRRDWVTNRVIVKQTDRGLLLRPMPPDPIAAAMGSLKGKCRRDLTPNTFGDDCAARTPRSKSASGVTSSVADAADR
jgi:hypothetical protein